nr:retrovirus-related Pol polyprotein from transposon TNT 1-94 [Tanacetum cinerariifolium]
MMTSIHVCLLAFFHKKNPRGYIKLLKIQVGLKLCRKSSFNSRCRRNKARLIAQGHTQEEGIDYEEVFAPVARIKAIRLFLAYASFMGFMVYQMDVKSAFLYGTIEEEVYVCQPLGFEDPDYPDKVYKVVKALYDLHQAHRACQDKYVAEILRKFGLADGKSTSTPMNTEKPLLKDPDGEDVDVHIYRSIIGSLMYLTLTRPDIMFAVIEFGDSYEAPGNVATTGSASDGTAKHSRGNEEVNTASVSTASSNVSTASANIRVASITQDTACAYIASQSSSFQIKFEDINQIDEDDMEEIDIKWNMALLSMRADRASRSQDRGRRDNYKQGSKVEEQAPKALMEIDRVGWDWSYMANDDENHALVADEEAPSKFALVAKTSADSEVFDNSLCSKACKKNYDSLNSFQTASKDLDSLLESQRLDKNKEGLGYSVVPPPPAQIYSSPKKDMSWTGLFEFKDDTVTDYSRPSPAIESTLDDAQNRNPFVTETEALPSTISPKPFIKFVKANDIPTKSKTDKVETAKKPPVKYAEQYKKPTKKPNAYVTAVSSKASAVWSDELVLLVNPNIYVSCIKQFWTTVAVKKVNDVIRLQALVNKKKVVVTEAIIRETLRLDDTEGVECLPNEKIFTELARMGYEKSSTKLTFYKAFFSS